MINKKTLLAALLGACVALPLPVLAQDSSSDNDPVTLRVAYDADPVSLDIHEQLSGGILQLSHLVFDPLVRWTQDFEFEPRLATSWEQIDDTTLQMKLRKGVEFHSGNAFTAKDVAWTV
ncbi:ABC transporter substrate-binding protein, partial [Chromohalobacter sp.]